MTTDLLLAYIDPGSGALVWQALIAGFVGAAYYFRKFLGRLLGRRAEESRPADPHD